MYKIKNVLFFILFLAVNIRLLKVLFYKIYIPFFVQFEWLKKYNINKKIKSPMSSPLIRKLQVPTTTLDKYFKGKKIEPLFHDVYQFIVDLGSKYIGENRESHFYPNFSPTNQITTIFVNPQFLEIVY